MNKPGDLDRAWRAAEAALPDGYTLARLGLHPNKRWLAQAFHDEEGMAFSAGWGDTPTDALNDLAARLKPEEMP